MAKYQAPKGTFDILPRSISPIAWQSSSIWSNVEEVLKRLCHHYGIEELRLPVFENTELFQKGTGESSDVVQKEMYTFTDKGKRSQTLRPEGTPGSLRALIESGAFNSFSMQKIFYLGPMFRYERPQMGRYRQFNQFGVEILGPRSPWLDAECICLGSDILKALGLSKFKLLINTLASQECRQGYKKLLQEYFGDHLSVLSEDSQRRLTTNPLRILDSKDAGDQSLIAQAPKLRDHLDSSSSEFFEGVLEYLKELNISYSIDDKLVRGFDYYCDTVFEWQVESIGAQSAIGGGGRYGKLLSDMGGPTLEGVGFAMGMERLIQATLACNQQLEQTPRIEALFVAIGKECAKKLFTLAHEARSCGLCIETWPLHDPKKLKNALSYGDKIGAKSVIILGENELSNNQATYRHMQGGEEKKVSLQELSSFLKSQSEKN